MRTTAYSNVVGVGAAAVAAVADQCVLFDLEFQVSSWFRSKTRISRKKRFVHIYRKFRWLFRFEKLDFNWIEEYITKAADFNCNCNISMEQIKHHMDKQTKSKYLNALDVLVK